MLTQEVESRTADAVALSHTPLRRLSESFNSVYPQLRAMAAMLMRRERVSHTLQPTAVVSEAFVRLATRECEKPFESEAHVLAYAATTMRSVLVDHARKRMSKKRGTGTAIDIALLDVLATSNGLGVDIAEMDDALRALEAADARAARVVEARVFGGLSIEEIAVAMDMSQSSVSRDWRFGRAFLAGQLSDDVQLMHRAREAA